MILRIKNTHQKRRIDKANALLEIIPIENLTIHKALQYNLASKKEFNFNGLAV